MGDLQLLLAFQVAPLLATKHGVDLKLYHLLKRISEGVVYPGDLARVMFESPSKISRRLDKLEAMGLIGRVLDEADSRRIRVELEPGANEAIERMTEEFTGILAPALASLPASETTLIVSSLEAIFNRLLPTDCVGGPRRSGKVGKLDVPQL